MRIGRGIIPPGKAGLVMLAAAVAPVVLRKAKPLAKAVGRGIAKLGEAVERIADNSTVDAQDKEAERIRSQASQDQPDEKNMNQESNEPNTGAPDERTASPIAHEELDAHKAKQAKKKAKSPEAEKKRKEPKAGAEPPQNNPKRARRAPPDIDTA